MHRRIMLALLLMLAISLAGCGGSDSGNDNNIDPNTSLIGTWQPISATRAGVSVPVSSVMPDTNTPATRWEIDFNQNGTVVFRAFRPDNSLIETLNGTWSSENQVAPVVVDGNTTNIQWSDFGNVMTANYTLEGQPVVARWVRTNPAPTGHESGWVGQWQLQSLAVNGVATSPATYFGWAANVTSERLTLQANGTAVLAQMSDSTVVSSQDETWATGSNVFTLTNEGRTLWGYWEGQFLVLVFLDPATGNAVTTSWTRLGA